LNDRTHSNGVETVDPVPDSQVYSDFAVAKLMDAVAVLDSDYKFAAWSGSASELLGWSEADLLGRPVDHVLVAEGAGGAHARLSSGAGCKSAGPSMTMAARRKDGAMVQVEIRVVPFRLHNVTYLNVTLTAQASRAVQNALLERQSSLVTHSRDSMFVLGMSGEVEYWNCAAERMFGLSVKDALGASVDRIFSFGAALGFSTIKKILLRTGHWEGELLCRRSDGSQLAVLSRWGVERNSAGRPLRILVSNTDAGVWKQYVQTSPRERRQNFDALFGQHPDGVFSFDLRRRLVAVNPEMCRLTGHDANQLLEMPLSRLVREAQLPTVRAAFFEALRGKPQTLEFTCVRRDGTDMDASITLLPNIVDERIVGLHGILKDISQRKRDERRIVYLANHDALTGLPNRNLLHDRMQHAIDQARRCGTQACVLFMDLNRFKVINDSLGHDKGDQLLCAIADRFKNALRGVDTVARIGGDEFVVLIEDVHDVEHVSRVAQSLLALVAQPVVLGDTSLSVTTSIGASVYPGDGDDAVALLKHADLAMYAAKRPGSGGFRFYSADMNDRAIVRLTRENSLRNAISGGQLVLHYQPRLDLARNEIVGLEALVRWDHPGKGLIYPTSFIELAEETGLIDGLGEWVLTAACTQMRAWRDAGLRPIRMSVNVSAIQLNSERLFAAVAAALNAAQLEPSFLELEITESSLMQNLEASQAVLGEFRRMGISLSIDDFGTGYSSLNYLKRLPIDTLKIDRSFVHDVSNNEDDAAIVRATIAMAHSMHLKVVAEGVTSFDQLHLLQEWKCDEIQGYLLCQPLPAGEVESFFRTAELRGIHYSWAH
jgi:diguanylate cyclase (GGDEF)-like protein/PAS domain S-box-containing protein